MARSGHKTMLYDSLRPNDVVLSAKSFLPEVKIRI